MADINYSRSSNLPAGRGYANAQAERDKFLYVEPGSLGIPASAYPYDGKYAVLTYNIVDSTSLGTSANPMYTNITTVISSVELDLSGNLHVEQVEYVGEIQTPVSSIQITHVPLKSLDVKSCEIPAYSVSSIAFSPFVQQIEIANNSTDTIYFLLSNATDHAAITGLGLPLDSTAYYSNVGYIDYVSVASTTVESDVRIIGRR